MQNNNIEVKIPKNKKRLKKQGKNIYVYYVVSRKSNKDPLTKDIVQLIGKVSKNGYMFPNEHYFKFFPEEDISIKSIELNDFDSQSKIGAIAAIYHIADELGLSKCIEYIFKEDASLILSLASYYILARDSCAMLYADFMFDHYGKCKEIVSEATISRLFNQRITVEKVDSFRSAFLNHSYINIKKKGKHKTRLYLDIDSTNENVSSKNCHASEFGKAKVDEDLPQINMAYFYDKTSGIPIFYDCFYGSITDLSYVKVGFEQFLSNLNQSTSGIKYDFVLDRGYFSSFNLNYLSNQNISFVILGKSNLQFSEYINKYSEEIKSSKNLLNLGTYGIKLKGKVFSKGNEKEYNIYIYYDSTKEVLEKSHIEQILINAKKVFENKIIDKKGDLERVYQKYITIEKYKNGKIKKYQVNENNVDKLLKEAGYFWIVSTIDVSPLEILEIYRSRDEIEKCFRMVKSENDLNKTYAQNDNALYAKTMMGFITAVIRSELTFLTRNLSKSKNNISVQKMLLTLDKIIMNKIHDHYALKYSFTAFQQEIMNAINLKKEVINDIISDWNNINKKSK